MRLGKFKRMALHEGEKKGSLLSSVFRTSLFAHAKQCDLSQNLDQTILSNVPVFLLFLL